MKETIQQYFIGECGLEISGLKDDTSLFLSGLLDSIDVIGLISFLEKKFKIKINAFDLSLEDLDTTTKIINFLKSKLR